MVCKVKSISAVVKHLQVVDICNGSITARHQKDKGSEGTLQNQEKNFNFSCLISLLH